MNRAGYNKTDMLHIQSIMERKFFADTKAQTKAFVYTSLNIWGYNINLTPATHSLPISTLRFVLESLFGE
jgi:hypothetical protein